MTEVNNPCTTNSILNPEIDDVIFFGEEEDNKKQGGSTLNSEYDKYVAIATKLTRVLNNQDISVLLESNIAQLVSAYGMKDVAKCAFVLARNKDLINNKPFTDTDSATHWIKQQLLTVIASQDQLFRDQNMAVLSAKEVEIYGGPLYPA
jgi:hypothetical protein